MNLTHQTRRTGVSCSPRLTMRNKTALTLTKDELNDLYGIELREDGTVFDPVENRKFKTLTAWLEFIEEHEQDEMYGSFEKRGSSKYYDDEY